MNRQKTDQKFGDVSCNILKFMVPSGSVEEFPHCFFMDFFGGVA